MWITWLGQFSGFSKVCLLVWMRTCQCRLGVSQTFFSLRFRWYCQPWCRTWGNGSKQYGCFQQKIGVVNTPNHPFVHRVWNHYFHHPFWGFAPYFWKHPYGLNTPDGHLKGVNRPCALKKPAKACQCWFLAFSTNNVTTRHWKQEQGTMSPKHQEKIKHKHIEIEPLLSVMVSQDFFSKLCKDDQKRTIFFNNVETTI